MDANEEALYQIVLDGRLDIDWAECLGAISVRVDQGEDGDCQTVIVCTISDQPALRGILTQLWDLNLALVSVQRIKRR